MKQRGPLGGSPCCGEEASLAAVIIKKGCWGCGGGGWGRSLALGSGPWLTLCAVKSPTPASEGGEGEGRPWGLGPRKGPLRANGKPGHVWAEEGQQEVVGSSRVCAHQSKAIAS